jgi:S-methylmethionine-dependent homocysteine/selenocysteine methylase
MPPMGYRGRLPQLAGGLFMTDGGMETTLIFRDGLVLPSFAAFDLLKDTTGTDAIRRYFEPYLATAREYGVGLILESPTWRANRDWGEKLGYTAAELDQANRKAVALIEEIRSANDAGPAPIVLSGCVGPRGDGYRPTEMMTAADAERYHAEQIATLSETSADMVSALTIPYAEEAIGIARASRRIGIPVVVSFTVETDGRLPSGQRLKDAIAQVDADTDGMPSYFMINCAHPTHFAAVLEDGEPWVDRIRGLRANASSKSHAELDEATELDAGDPAELGAQYRTLRPRLRNVNVVGGCCGTDERHVAAVCRAWRDG